jgi:hypothetical protein
MVPLERTVENKDPRRIFLLGTLFLTVIPRETMGNQILLQVFLLGAYFI